MSRYVLGVDPDNPSTTPEAIEAELSRYRRKIYTITFLGIPTAFVVGYFLSRLFPTKGE